MNQTESQLNNPNTHSHQQSSKDVQICNDCIALMRSAAEKCRSWREESTSQACKGGLGTSAFVCDSLASSMEACMKLMGTGAKAAVIKKDCCS
jgi:ribosomal protein L40E